jgi:acetyl-CoA carboxylase biotin carboxyl carrier protein
MSADEPTDGAGKARRPNVDADIVRELSALLEETGLSEIEIEEGGARVRVARHTHAHAAPVMGAAPSAQSAGPPKEAENNAKRGTTLTSPMVGTAYMGPSPGAPPFVQVGESVKDGQTLIIIEAMKTMNQVPSTASGRVLEIYVQDGQPVEFGEALMLIG